MSANRFDYEKVKKKKAVFPKKRDPLTRKQKELAKLDTDEKRQALAKCIKPVLRTSSVEEALSRVNGYKAQLEAS